MKELDRRRIYSKNILDILHSNRLRRTEKSRTIYIIPISILHHISIYISQKSTNNIDTILMVQQISVENTNKDI